MSLDLVLKYIQRFFVAGKKTREEYYSVQSVATRGLITVSIENQLLAS